MVECVRAVRGTAAGAAGMFSSYMQLCPHLNKMSFYLLACFVHKLCTLTLCVANGTVPTFSLECQLNSSGGCISHYQMYCNYCAVMLCKYYRYDYVKLCK